LTFRQSLREETELY